MIVIGETISHYRIIGELGKGGMGVVYEALDLNLGRRVAIKLLPEIAAQSTEAAKRLQREARTLSTLNHPNICTIYELGEHAGQPYLVEELLVGATLQEMILKRKMKTEFVMDFVIQIADGLKAAHARGLVHRDIKPANLFVTEENRAKILDFGLARQAAKTITGPAEAVTIGPGNELDPDQITHPGKIVGTLDYMSPEQVRGETTTPSSDVFALGIVLFELLYGNHPFKKKSPLETASAILTEPIENSSMSREFALSGLNTVLARMLAKDINIRYADGGVLLEELKQARAGALGQALNETATFTARPRKASLAVLPFVNLSADPENEYFCDGLAEELVGALAKVDELRVAAWTSAFRFRGKGKDNDLNIRDVGKQLGVALVLEGSLRRSGNRLRISAKLLDAENGYHVWSERYDRELEDVFAIQEEIAGAIVAQLRVKLGLNDGKALIEAQTPSVEAYNLYLKGRYFWNRRRPADIEKAIESFQRALKEDARYAPALVGLADSYVVQGVQGARNPNDVFPRAREAAQKALEINSEMGEAFASLACVEAAYDWNWAAAEQHFQQAILLNPKNGTAHQWYASHLLIPVGRFAEGRRQVEIARQNDPLSLAILATEGLIAYFERDADRAIREYEKALEMDANFALAHYFLGQAYELKGRQEESIAAFTRAVESTPDSSEMAAALARAVALSGDGARAEAMLGKLRDKSANLYVSPVLFAQVLLGFGRNDEAIAELQRARELRATDLMWLKVRPVFDGLRGDARFADVVAAVGLE